MQGRGTEWRGRRHDLRNRIDRQPGDGTIGDPGHVQEGKQDRQPQNDCQTTCCGEGDCRADILI